MSNTQPFVDFFRNGKTDIDFKMEDGYVIGVCCLYPDRTAGNQEFVIRETSVVEKDARGLTACVQEAKDSAYESAVRHYLRVFSPPQTTSNDTPKTVLLSEQAQKENPLSAKSAASDTPQADQEAPPPAGRKENLLQQADTESISFSGEPSEDEIVNSEPEAKILVPDGEKAKVVSIDSLVSASSMIRSQEADDQAATALATVDAPAAEESGTENGGDDEAAVGISYEEALNTTITICGKAHQCYKKTAKDLLECDPQTLVFLTTRAYGGDKITEYEALKALYYDAVERVNAA